MVTGFAGKTALITSAGRAIGRAVAIGLAAAGAGLILVARSASQLAQTQAILLGRGIGQVRIIPADLGDEDQRGTGVTVNAYRPGGVDTAMRAWIRHQDPGRIGTTMHERFSQNFADSTLITPGQFPAALIAHLGGDDTGAIWDVNTAPVRS